jgi:hypothetical protein
MLIKASDAKSWSQCHRRAWFDNYSPPGAEASESDPFEQMIVEKGNLLEQKYLQLFRTKHQVIEALSVEHTKELMASGVEVIYQGFSKKMKLLESQISFFVIYLAVISLRISSLPTALKIKKKSKYS